MRIALMAIGLLAAFAVAVSAGAPALSSVNVAFQRATAAPAAMNVSNEAALLDAAGEVSASVSQAYASANADTGSTGVTDTPNGATLSVAGSTSTILSTTPADPQDRSETYTLYH